MTLSNNLSQNLRDFANRGIVCAAKCFITLTIGDNFIKLFNDVIYDTIKVTPVKTIGIMPIMTEIMPKMFIILTLGDNLIKLFYDIIVDTFKVTPVKTLGIMPIVA